MNLCGNEIHYKTIALVAGVIFIFIGIACGIVGCVFTSRLGTIMTNIASMVMTAGTSTVIIGAMLYLLMHQVKKIARNNQQYTAVETNAL